MEEEVTERIKRSYDAKDIRNMRKWGHSDTVIGGVVDMLADEVDDFMRNYVE